MTDQLYLCRNRVFALIWRLLLLWACGLGLWPLFFGRGFSSQSLCFFTTQSNIFVALMAAALLIGTAAQLRDGAAGDIFRLPPWLQLGVTYFIQITFLVYASMLSDYTFSMGYEMGISNILLHYVVPIMALIDWILFLPHGQVGFKHAALWLLYPSAYVVFCFIRAELGRPFSTGSRFPYFFMDADALGWNLLWIAPAFFAGYFALGALIAAVDRALAKRLRAKTPTEG